MFGGAPTKIPPASKLIPVFNEETTMNGKWGLLLALAGGVAIGSVIAMDQRGKKRHRSDKRLRKNGLQAWEGEGGSVAAPQGQAAIPAG